MEIGDFAGPGIVSSIGATAGLGYGFGALEFRPPGKPVVTVEVTGAGSGGGAGMSTYGGLWTVETPPK